MSLPPFIKSYSTDTYEETKRFLMKEKAIDLGHVNIVEDDDEEGLATGRGIGSIPTIPTGLILDPLFHIKGEKSEDEESQTKQIEGYRIDKLFFRICWLTFVLGINFYRYRTWWQKAISIVIVFTAVSINFCFMGFLVYAIAKGPFDAEQIVMNLGIITASLQATLSTIFLAFWQYSQQSCGALKQIYAAHEGAGIAEHRIPLLRIVKKFYIVIGFLIIFTGAQIVATALGHDNELIIWAKHMREATGSHVLIYVFLFGDLYTLVAWAVALFVFVLLIQSTHYEFVYFNDRVRKISTDRLQNSDEELCDVLICLIKVHNRLTDCVKRLDTMFHRYAFIMIATTIPTMIFALFMFIREVQRDAVCIFFSTPIICFCIFSFFALTNSPSQLHQAIYETKSALCSNTKIWFPYRPNVYHSALAFVCHLDQANLGISIWGFAVVSKPLVLTSLSVMVTCIALFLQFSQCTI